MLEVRQISKIFDGDFHALGPLDLDLDGDHILGVVGPSGCGKSTLLRLIAGLEVPTEGVIRLDDRPVTGPRADIGVVFQEPRLLPWLTVEENVGFGLWDAGRAERRDAVAAALAKVALERFARSLPKQLSGGMAQRVGIARALVARPRLLLLDEPFAALDPLTRIRMQDHLLDIVGNEVPNVVLITHDIEEALVLSDRILLLDGPPALIRRDVPVALARPRRRSAPEFQALKDMLLGELLD